jgi:hypothetical protein
LVNASGPNSRPSCASSVNTGMKDSVMISSEKNSAGPTSSAASVMTFQRSSPTRRLAGVAVLPGLELLVRVLDHHHRRVDHRADGDRDAAQRHDVGVDALVAHHQEGGQDAQRQRDDGHQRRAQMPEEEHADRGDDEELLDQLEAEVAIARSISALRS